MKYEKLMLLKIIINDYDKDNYDFDYTDLINDGLMYPKEADEYKVLKITTRFTPIDDTEKLIEPISILQNHDNLGYILIETKYTKNASIQNPFKNNFSVKNVIIPMKKIANFSVSIEYNYTYDKDNYKCYCEFKGINGEQNVGINMRLVSKLLLKNDIKIEDYTHISFN